MLAHALAQLALNLVAVGQDVFEGSVLSEELGGGFLADSGDSGNVVDRVAHQSQDIDDLIHPLNAPLFADLGGPHHFGGLASAGRLVHLDSVGDKLPKILVRRHHEHLKAGLFGLVGQGSDHVVGLVTRHAQRRNAQCPQ